MKNLIFSILMITLAILFMSAPAIADDITFRWINSIANTDGSPFDPATEQVGTRIYCDIDPATFVPQTPAIGDKAAVPQTNPIFSYAQNDDTSTTERGVLTPGFCFATMLNITDKESYPSNTVEFVSTPGPPTDFRASRKP